jgi:hypothetical protein
VVLTLPAEIAPIAYQNKAVVYDLLFRTAAETLLTIAADPKNLGARIGFTAVLHTWGSLMTHHPHLLVIVGGGISLDGSHWVRCRPGFLLPVRVLSRLFRRLFLAGLADPHAAGRLAFCGESRACSAARPLPLTSAPLSRKNWFVYAKPPFAGPEAVLAYFSPATPIALPSRTAACSLSTSAASASATRTIVETGRRGIAGRSSHPTSSSGASCSTSCQSDFTASATTGCSRAATCKANITRARQLIAAPGPSVKHDTADIAAATPIIAHRARTEAAAWSSSRSSSVAPHPAARHRTPAGSEPRNLEPNAMTVLTASLQRLFAGTSRFRRRAHLTPAPASADTNITDWSSIRPSRAAAAAWRVVLLVPRSSTPMTVFTDRKGPSSASAFRYSIHAKYRCQFFPI